MRFLGFEKTPILFDLPLISHDLLFFWEFVQGVDAKLSSKFRWIWTSFARDLPFEVLVAGSLGATGLGFQFQPDRSDRSEWAV